MHRLLTPADERKLEARKVRWLSGKDRRSLAAFKATCLWGLGTPAPRGFVRDAVRRHGHHGLRALDIAATEVLAGDSPERRQASQRRSPRTRRVVRRARQHSPPRDDGDPEPPLADGYGPQRLGPYVQAEALRVIPLRDFMAAVDRWLSGEAA